MSCCKTFSLGIDLGSTTVKYALFNENGLSEEKKYVRHRSAVVSTLTQELKSLAQKYPGISVRTVMTGSGALYLAPRLNAQFVQEVVAAGRFLRNQETPVDVAVELGGEDAKILYLTHGVELRMNESCAGGTGAFIDQMAATLMTDTAGLDAMSAEAVNPPSIASRCGVFAKTDVVALLNAGSSRGDIAQAIFNAVVEQVIGGLACGRPIRGNVAFLGGPLNFLPHLTKTFEHRITENSAGSMQGSDTKCLLIENAQYGPAIGACLEMNRTEAQPGSVIPLDELVRKLETLDSVPHGSSNLMPLFTGEEEVTEFLTRHSRNKVPAVSINEAVGPLFLGIDLGSTTIKVVAVDSEGCLCYHRYAGNDGKPLERMLPLVAELTHCVSGGAFIRSICTTGYGADLAASVLGAQFSEVETLAHQRAAVAFDKDVSYVIDIGGQDMKCMKVRDGTIVSVALNEACSSGCGAFLQTFSAQLGITLSEFVEGAFKSQRPADLGSRCTVFMTSRVRQAQRDGADNNDIAAGLCISVVKNALHKVLRLKSGDDLGDHIVVQGGTFLNNAVLRAFEQHTGKKVIRPDLAGIMGAYGAALLAMERTDESTPELNLTPETFSLEGVRALPSRCKGCNNHCALTISVFPSGRKFISGNRCDFGSRHIKQHKTKEKSFAEMKLDLLFDRTPLDPQNAPNGRIGIARVLNMYEHYPFWFTLFTELGFSVVLSQPSSRAVLELGVESLPSQSLCLPGKLAHGHATQLSDAGVRTLWMPCVPREHRQFDESLDTYACPVVAGYPEALSLNIRSRCPELSILTPYVEIFDAKSIVRAFGQCFPKVASGDVKRAFIKAHEELRKYRDEILARARAVWESDDRVIVLAGRPYHLDAFVNHGIPALIDSMGAQVLTEDVVSMFAPKTPDVDVINQWAFHARLYRAVEAAMARPRTELVHLVSFGCGIDAITSEQIKRLTEKRGRLYTMLKIDETDALGAARIRLRSLFAAADMKEKKEKSQRSGS